MFGVSEEYEGFVLYWDSIALSVIQDADSDKHRKFFFNFLFRLFLSGWTSLRDEEKHEVRLIAMKEYKFSLPEVEQHITSLRATLPSFTLESEAKENISDFIELLSDTISEYEVLNSHTFDGAISRLPEKWNCPPEFAFSILRSLGYEQNDSF